MSKSISFGRYMSTYDFVESNELGTEATELFGIDWEAESDVEQIQELIEYVGGKGIYVRHIEGLKSDEDIEVGYEENWTEIERLKTELEKYKNGYDELMCYWDSIGDEEKPLLHERLQKLGL